MSDKLENIGYKVFQEQKVSDQRLEEYLNLLHKYLQKFISKDTLKEDLKQCFEGGRVIGVYHKNRLIGAAAGIYTPFFDKFHIAHLAVEKEFQGKGLGRNLIDQVIPEDTGASVHLNLDNPEIEKFYKKLGFEPTHTRFKRAEDKEKKPSD